jgi:hypothetical protein
MILNGVTRGVAIAYAVVTGIVKNDGLFHG